MSSSVLLKISILPFRLSMMSESSFCFSDISAFLASKTFMECFKFAVISSNKLDTL